VSVASAVSASPTTPESTPGPQLVPRARRRGAPPPVRAAGRCRSAAARARAREVPCPAVAEALLDRPDLESRRQRPRCVEAGDRDLGWRDPPRKRLPLVQAALEQELARGPREPNVARAGHARRGVEEVAERERLLRRAEVEDAARSPFAHREREPRDVSRVDQLHREPRRLRRQHLVAARHPPEPVRHPVQVVVRPADVPRANDQRAVAVDAPDLVLGEHLERAVGHAGDVLGRRVVDRREPAGLVLPGDGLVRVDRERRDERVVRSRVTERLGRHPREARDVARRIEHGIPRPPRERRQVLAAVAADPLGLGEQVRLRLAAIEQRDLVTGGERLLDEGTADELRPAQHQDPHEVEPYRRLRPAEAWRPRSPSWAGGRDRAAPG
jgi:hypothetical protein